MLGALLIIVPLALELSPKASAADTMNKHLKPVYTSQMLAGARGSLATVGAMGQEMQTKMLPGLGQQLGMDSAQLSSFFGQNLRAMGAGMANMPQAMGRFTSLLTVFNAHLSDYNTLKPVGFAPVVWTMIVGGIVALLAGAWAAIVRRTPEVSLP